MKKVRSWPSPAPRLTQGYVVFDEGPAMALAALA